MFQHCPLLSPLYPKFDEMFEQFNQYRWSVPVCGCLMLNQGMDQVVLVKGWSKLSNWTFPKGKIAKDEEKMPCAVREVLEETSFDCGPLVTEEDYIDIKINGKQDVRLYIAWPVPQDFEFECQTQKEISKIDWIKISDLKPGKKGKIDTDNTYGVLPFMGKLRQWIKEHRGGQTKPSPVQKPQPTAILQRGAADPGAGAAGGVIDVGQLESQL
eukprot:COSAG01_NODE_21491_length_899_cov_33.803750_1_plen_212_part_10